MGDGRSEAEEGNRECAIPDALRVVHFVVVVQAIFRLRYSVLDVKFPRLRRGPPRLLPVWRVRHFAFGLARDLRIRRWDGRIDLTGRLVRNLMSRLQSVVY